MKLSRLEDRRLVTGTGCYTADWSLPGQLHAAMLRADRAHARIAAIDLDAARAAPGVRAIVTWRELAAAGVSPFQWGPTYPGKDGQTMRRARYPALADGVVRFVGEPLAMVVADTREQALEACEQVVVDYQDLPAVVGIDAALAPDAARVHDDIARNLAFEYESGDRAAVEAAFARALHVTRLTVDSQRLVGNPMEPRACLASWDAAGERLSLRVATQGGEKMRSPLSALLGLAPERIEVITRDVGGSFGIRSVPYPEYLCAIVAARQLGRPVKWVGTRSECFATDVQGRAIRLHGELALDERGNFLAIRFEDHADLGAYPSAWGAFIATRGLTITMGGVYRVPAMHAITRCVYTTTAPVSAYRGAGRPDIAYAIERLVDQAAFEHGFDPVELRRRNYVPSDAMPYRTANGTVYDCGDFAGVLEDALRHSDWAGFEARREQSARTGRLRGIGLASYLEASGGGSAPKDEAIARFDADGRLHVYVQAMSSGQGHETAFVQILAQRLGLPAEEIRYHASDPAVDVVGNGTGGSRSLVGAGSALRLLADKLLERARPQAARLLEADAEELDFADGAWRVRGTQRAMRFDALARRLAEAPRAGSDAANHPLDCSAEGRFGVTFPNGCHVAEVEIDPETGVTTIERYTAVDDLGNIVSRQLVEGQLHGGIAQGAGQVFGEAAIHDPETGQLLTGSFMDYPMPRAGMLPVPALHEHPVPTASNALGAKGVGESGCSGSLPALMNAVMDAARRAGVRELDMPVTPARMWAALRAAGR